jgi:hypothetical protein
MAWMVSLVKRRLNSGIKNKKAAREPGGFFSEQG